MRVCFGGSIRLNRIERPAKGGISGESSARRAVERGGAKADRVGWANDVNLMMDYRNVIRSSAFCGVLLWVGAATVWAAAGASVADGDGWTRFEKSAGVRVVYVSSSAGDDRQRGFSPETAVRTIRRGMSLLRRGHGDWLLFKRGDVFTRPIGYVAINGAGHAQPAVFGNYGDKALPRPEFTAPFVVNTFNGAWHHVAFLGLHFNCTRRNPSSDDYDPKCEDAQAFRWLTRRSSDVLVEDCLFEWYGTGIDISGVSGLRIRGNVVRDCYSNGKRDSQGVYLDHCDHVLIEGNVLDRNGYVSFVGGGRSVRNHDLYLHNCVDVNVRNNIVARSASIGIKCKGEGAPGAAHDVTVRGNLFLADPIGLTFDQNGEVNYNVRGIHVTENVFARLGGRVVMEGGKKVWLGLGVQTKSISDATFSENIFVDTRPVKGGVVWAINVSDWRPQRKIVISHNTVGATFRYTTPRALISRQGATNFVGNQVFRDASVDAGASIDSYDRSIAGAGTMANFLHEARKQRKGCWRAGYTGVAVARYFAHEFSEAARR